jgi:hypothetical protein
MSIQHADLRAVPGVSCVCVKWLPARRPGCPLVSAIVSAYNSERFIRGCLEDLEAQTIADRLEILVIDSASPQNEAGLVAELREQYGNIAYMRTPVREGVYASWNRGIRHARGEFLTNANTDDRHSPRALERLATTLSERPDVALVYADDYITQTENESFENHSCCGALELEEFGPTTLLSRCHIGPHPMWRRRLHEQHGYFDESYQTAGDYEFWLQLAATETLLHVPEKLGLYLWSPSSVEHVDPERASRETLRARVEHLEFERQFECEIAEGDACARVRFENAEEIVEVEADADMMPVMRTVADHSRFSASEALAGCPEDIALQRLHTLTELASTGLLLARIAARRCSY